MRYLAVVHKIEGNVAMLKVGPGEYLVRYPLAYLPPVSAGAVLSIEIGLNSTQAGQRLQQNGDELITKLLRVSLIESNVKHQDGDDPA